MTLGVIWLFNPSTTNVPMIQKPVSRANQLTCFDMMGPLVVKGLRYSESLVHSVRRENFVQVMKAI